MVSKSGATIIASPKFVDSKRECAEFVNGSDLYLALKSSVDATVPASALAASTSGHTAMQASQNAEILREWLSEDARVTAE